MRNTNFSRIVEIGLAFFCYVADSKSFQGTTTVSDIKTADLNADGLADIVTDRSSVNGPNAFINTGGHFIPVTADVSIWNAVEFYTLQDPNDETVWGIKPYDDTIEIAEIPLSFYGANISVRNGGAARDTLNGGESTLCTTVTPEPMNAAWLVPNPSPVRHRKLWGLTLHSCCTRTMRAQ